MHSSDDRNMSVGRMGGGLLVGLILVSSVSLAACQPGELDCMAVTCPTTGGTGGTGGTTGFNCSLGTTMEDVEKKLFKQSTCLTCHSKTPLAGTNLDLESPGLAGRMVDKPGAPNGPNGKCGGKVLVPKDNPTGGLLLEKVAGKPSCGDQMPVGIALSKDEVECVKMWADLASKL